MDTYYNPRAEKDAFDAAHGERVQWNDTFYFEDGAARSTDAVAELRPPPAREFDRLTMILYFHKVKLARAVQAFDNLKEQLMHQNCGNGAETSRLKELQAKVGECSKGVAKAQAALENTDIGRIRKANAEDRAREGQAIADYQAKIKAIRI